MNHLKCTQFFCSFNNSFFAFRKIEIGNNESIESNYVYNFLHNKKKNKIGKTLNKHVDLTIR